MAKRYEVFGILIFLLITLLSTFSHSTGFFLQNGSLVSIVCGDSFCSVGEHPSNCPIDCLGKSFGTEVETQLLYLMPGSSVNQSLSITPYHSDVRAYLVSSDSPAIVNISRSVLQTNISQEIILTFTAPVFPETSIITGSVIVSSLDENVTIPFTIQLITTDLSFARPNLEIISSKIIYSKPVTYSTDIIFSGTRNRSIDIYLKVNDTFHLLETFTTSRPRFDYQGIIQLDRYEKVPNYELLLNVTEDNRSITIQKELVVEQSFIESWQFTSILLVFLGLPMLYGIYLLFAFLRKKQLQKRRYIVPNYSLLPGKSDRILQVGKIADTTKNAFFNSSDLTTHMLVAGSTGSGKSVTASIIVEEVLRKKIPVVIFDPTAQWTGLLSPLKDKQIMKGYSNFELSPDDATSFRGIIFTPTSESFDLDIEAYLNPGEVTIFNLSGLTITQYDQSVKKIIDTLFNRHWEESSDLQVLVVFDEVHRLLDKNLSGEGYAALTKACREFRKWGVGLIMASQVSSDFKETIGGNVLTEVQLNTKNLEDIKKIGKKYGPDFAHRITRQGIGVALIQNARYNNGKPWFIHFRPPLHNPRKLSEVDLKMYETYTVRIGALKRKIDAVADSALKEDLVMEYHLAYNKLKEGKFKMAEIYIQSLEERV